MTARAKFQKQTAEVLRDWQMGNIPPRPNWSVERELYKAGIAEILKLRLTIAFLPLLEGLQRIENRVKVLAELREDPYAPPPYSATRQQIRTRWAKQLLTLPKDVRTRAY